MLIESFSDLEKKSHVAEGHAGKNQILQNLQHIVSLTVHYERNNNKIKQIAAKAVMKLPEGTMSVAIEVQLNLYESRPQLMQSLTRSMIIRVHGPWQVASLREQLSTIPKIPTECHHSESATVIHRRIRTPGNRLKRPTASTGEMIIWAYSNHLWCIGDAHSKLKNWRRYCSFHSSASRRSTSRSFSPPRCSWAPNRRTCIHARRLSQH